MSRLTLALFAVAALSCQPDNTTAGDTAAWNGHLQNAGRAQKSKQFERAEFELRAALRLLAKLPEERRMHTRVLAAIARLKADQGQFAAAGSLFVAAISTQMRGLEEGKGLASGDLVSDFVQLATVRNLQRDHVTASALVEKITSMREEGLVSFEPFDQSYFVLLGIQSDALRGRGLTAPADSVLARARAYQEYHQGFNAHIHDQYAKAEGHYRNAISAADSVLGASHPEIARFCRDLAAAYAAQGHHDRAAAMLERAVRILEQSDDSLTLAVALEDLATALEHLERAAQAREARDRGAALRRDWRERGEAGKG